MKKYLLIAISALIAVPLFNSCNKPNGNPEKDANNKLALIEKKQKLEIEILEKQLQVAEFYAEKNDYEGYQKFMKKFDRLDEKINNDKKREHRDEYRNIRIREEILDKKIRDNREQQTRDDYNRYEYDDYDGYNVEEVAY